ncbi:MAG: aminopeptidase [Peptoniphilaceae bacterium]|nr:aminopeptidase [Peptoniphilaceae bacterium]MDD7383087.1 aminopeptidase [Peptoniphilaceae bacterium]MDY3737522.1 aminopeptidase [Peptoniphilaceae bacterium]
MESKNNIKNFDKLLENYAKLAIEIGVNVQKDEDVLIKAPVEFPLFVQKLVKASYERGANEVFVEYKDENLLKLKYLNEKQNILNNVHDFEIEKLRYLYKERKVNVINVVGEDPDIFKDIDAKIIAQSNAKKSEKIKEFRKYTMNDIISWLVISIPTEKWAKKVFPNSKESVNDLWKEIFKTSRVDESYEKTKENWNKHIENLNKRADFLNSKKFKRLIYTSENGTNLHVNLPKNHIWLSAGSKNEKGNYFIPNIPTEEVFSAPDKFGVNGKLVATKPLVYNGVVINDFYFEFKDGKVINSFAKENNDTLNEMLNMDENSKYLGEIALVPYNSPISLSNILFFNTLFDENASCHFALGEAYPTCVENGANLNSEELEKIGLNTSVIHEDFMVGNKDLNITAINENNEEITIFKDGIWAF